MLAIQAFLTSDSGAASAEYALILAIVGAAVAASCIALGYAIDVAIRQAANCLMTIALGPCR